MAIIPNVGSEDARAAVVAAIMACTHKVPFLGRTISGLRLEYASEPDLVACTNGRRLRVNPDRFAAYEPDERVGIIAHEALHVLFRHAERFPPDMFDHDKANVAADYAINSWLLGKGFSLPDDALYDPQYDGMGAGQIYHQLPDKLQQQQPGWGKFTPAPDNDTRDPQEVPAGLVGSGLEELFAHEFGVQPRSHKLNLDRVLSRLLITDPVWQRTYRRPSRVHDDFPSSVERDERPRTVVGLDVSGSISKEVREKFLGVLSRVTIPVTVIACDMCIQPAWIWRDVCANNHAALCAGLPMQGGSTRLQPAINFAARERANLVYLTDGETAEQRFDRKGVPITWLVWGNGPNRAAMAPAGKIIMVEP